jgi:hypothetical protein
VPVFCCARRVGVHETLHFMERVTDEMGDFHNPICSCTGISSNESLVRQDTVYGANAYLRVAIV